VQFVVESFCPTVEQFVISFKCSKVKELWSFAFRNFCGCPAVGQALSLMCFEELETGPEGTMGMGSEIGIQVVFELGIF